MKKFFQSLAHAWSGIASLVRNERHGRIHAVCSSLVIVVATWLQLTRSDWCWIVVAIALVWSAESMNSALERLADRVTKEQDPLIGQAKDLAAGAVLCAAIGAAFIGLLVLGPPLWAKIMVIAKP